NIEKIFKSILFWLPEIQAKSRDDFNLPNIEEYLVFVQKDIEAKEFKDIYYKWLLNKDISILKLIPEKSEEDLAFVEKVITEVFRDYQEQFNDSKLDINKKTQFFMGKCMKALKGKISAS